MLFVGFVWCNSWKLLGFLDLFVGWLFVDLFAYFVWLLIELFSVGDCCLFFYLVGGVCFVLLLGCFVCGFNVWLD